MKVILHLHPHAVNDPYEELEVVEPQQEGFGLLHGFLTHEPANELADLLEQISALQTQYTPCANWYSHYYYCLAFTNPGIVAITHEYQPKYGFNLAYANIAIIIQAILEFRTNCHERNIELLLSSKEGPYKLVA